MSKTSPRRSLALQMVRELDLLEREGVRLASRVSREARLAALAAYRDGHDPAHAMQTVLDRMRPLLTEAMVSSFLVAREQTQRRSIAQRSGLELSLQMKALRSIARRQLLTASDIDRIAEGFGEEVTKTISTLQTTLHGKVLRAMNDLVIEQAHGRQGIKVLREAFEAAGVGQVRSHAIETVFRTEMQMAYGAARHQALRGDPAVDNILWGYEYVAVGDDRTRPGHLAMDGVRLPKDHPFWARNWPPNGWNCRCTVVEIFKDDREAAPIEPEPQVIDGQVVNPQADQGWSFNPATVFQTPVLDTDRTTR